MKDTEWGVVQHLEIEADTKAALLGACMVACVEHSKATHFATSKNADGSNSLRLLWTDSRPNTAELPFPLSGANEVAEFVSHWLAKQAKYPDEEPDTDGSVEQGFRVDTSDFYEVLRVTPTFIIYGK